MYFIVSTGSRNPAPEHCTPQHFSTDFDPATLTITLSITVIQTLTKFSVVEQNVTGTKTLGNKALGYDVLGQDVGHLSPQSPLLEVDSHMGISVNP